jgi:hypothetical protein
MPQVWNDGKTNVEVTNGNAEAPTDNEVAAHQEATILLLKKPRLDREGGSPTLTTLDR